MRKILISSAAALLCAAALPAVAAPARDVVAQDQVNQNDQATQQPRSREGGRRYCVRDTVSNSRLARRVCYTQAQWDEMRRTGEAGDSR